MKAILIFMFVILATVGYAQTHIVFTGDNLAEVKAFCPPIQVVNHPDGIRLRLVVAGKIFIATRGFLIVRDGNKFYILDPSDLKKNLPHNDTI